MEAASFFAGSPANLQRMAEAKKIERTAGSAAQIK